MNTEEIFTIALDLKDPWYVSKTEIQISESKKEIHLTIRYKKGYYVDSKGKSKIHDCTTRKWKHLNVFEHTCYIHCEVPRVLDENNTKPKTVAVPWARTGSGFTLLFEAYSMLLIEQEMPINKVGKVVREYPNRIWTIFNYWIGISYNAADHSGIEQLGIDETSSKKGHKYVTVAVDMKSNRVVHVTEGKGAETISQIADYLDSKGSWRDSVTSVCIDLSPSFISGVTKHFKNASIVFDRFHVKALLNKAMDTVRKSERKCHDELKGYKYVFLKNNKNLSVKLKGERDDLLELFPKLGEAYRLKVLFDDFWDMDNIADAKGFLAFWCDLVNESKIYPFIRFANTVKNHWKGITNYLQYRISNGILESINSKIQLAKRRARGYTNKNNFINMIYFIAGKLKFDYPHYST